MRSHHTLKGENDIHKAQIIESQIKLRDYHEKQAQSKQEMDLLVAAYKEKDLVLCQEREITAEHKERIKELEEKLQNQLGKNLNSFFKFVL